MTYAGVAGVVLGSGAAAGGLAWLTRRLVHIDVLRRHHEIGSSVFLQLGVIFAVLLAFVFSEVWSEYNTAANAIDQECGNLRGVIILAAGLPEPMRQSLTESVVHYMREVVVSEWPSMEAGRPSDAASQAFKALWLQAANMDITDARYVATRDQILSLLSQAHQNRATRLFEMVQAVPPLLWLLLISFTVVLVGFLFCFGIEYIASQVMFTGIFAAATAFVLIMVHLLDYPFEGALKLPPDNFQNELQRIAPLATR